MITGSLKRSASGPPTLAPASSTMGAAPSRWRTDSSVGNPSAAKLDAADLAPIPAASVERSDASRLL